MTDIKVIPFTGKNIRVYLPSIARLRTDVMRDYPFFQDKKIDDELKLLKKYTLSPEAIVVIVFDGSKIVGASTGIPFVKENEIMHKPFLEKGMDPNHIYYFSESVLLKPYRGRGLAHHFFDLREHHVTQMKRFNHICFGIIDRPVEDKGYLPLNHFWQKRGFVEQGDLTCHLSWKDINQETPSDKKLTFWTKEVL